MGAFFWKRLGSKCFKKTRKNTFLCCFFMFCYYVLLFVMCASGYSVYVSHKNVSQSIARLVLHHTHTCWLFCIGIFCIFAFSSLKNLLFFVKNMLFIKENKGKTNEKGKKMPMQKSKICLHYVTPAYKSMSLRFGAIRALCMHVYATKKHK